MTFTVSCIGNASFHYVFSVMAVHDAHRAGNALKVEWHRFQRAQASSDLQYLTGLSASGIHRITVALIGASLLHVEVLADGLAQVEDIGLELPVEEAA